MAPAPAPNYLRLYPAAACLSRPSVHHIGSPSSIFGISHYFAPLDALPRRMVGTRLAVSATERQRYCHRSNS